MSMEEFLASLADTRDFFSSICRDILLLEGWNQMQLAVKIGVTQSAISRWLSGTSYPRRAQQIRLLKLHSRARYHHWSSQQFFPICAFAESYPSELRAKATEALNDMLNSAALISPLAVDSNMVSVDLHIRSAPLPNYVSAYSFGNDLIAPNVFVVLVRDDLSPIEQLRIGWEEVYAHVVGYSHGDIQEDVAGSSGLRGLNVSPSMVQTISHRAIHESATHKGQEDEEN